MLEYYLRRLFYKVSCWFIPSKSARVSWGSKIGFGREEIDYKDTDSFVPSEVLAMMRQKSNVEFIADYDKTIRDSRISTIGGGIAYLKI